MIEKVRLLNFISHSETEISFQPGVTVFIGANGAGKSSVIDGITYALYGQHTRNSNQNLVKRGSGGASTSVEFSFGMRRYLVERRLNKKGQLERSVLKEIIDGSVRQLAAGERKQFEESLTSEVTKIIGLDYRKMKVAAIIQQGELDAIVKFTPKELKELINNLIGVDRLGLAYEMMRDIIDTFRSMAKNRYGYNDTDIQTMNNKISEQDLLVTSSYQRLLSLEKDIVILRDEEGRLSNRKREIELFKDKAERLKIILHNLVGYIKQKKGEIENQQRDLNEIIQRSKNYLKVAADEVSIMEQIERLKKDQARNDSLVQGLAREIAELEVLRSRPDEQFRIIERGKKCLELLKQENEIHRTHEMLESNLRTTEKTISNLQGEIGKLEGYRDTAERLEFKDNICPLCGSRVEKIKELFDRNAIKCHIEELQLDIMKLQEEKNKLMSEVERINIQISSIKEAYDYLAENNLANLQDILKIESDRKELVAKLVKLPQLKTDYLAVSTEQEELKKKMEGLVSDKNHVLIGKTYLQDHSISSLEDLHAIESKRDKLGTILSRLPEDLDALKTMSSRSLEALSVDEHSRQLLSQIDLLREDAIKFDEHESEERARDLEDLQTNRIPKTLGEIESRKTQKETAERERMKLSEMIDMANRMSSFVSQLNDIRNKVYYRDGPVSSSLRSWALRQIASKASDYAKLFGIGISAISLKEKARDITIECFGAKGLVEIESLSGGEKVAIALALRFAMAYLMGGYKIDFVILDEPTVHLDEERKASMVEIISGLGRANSPLKQVIIITHDAEIFENTEVDTVYRFEASPEGSSVKREE